MVRAVVGKCRTFCSFIVAIRHSSSPSFAIIRHSPRPGRRSRYPVPVVRQEPNQRRDDARGSGEDRIWEGALEKNKNNCLSYKKNKSKQPTLQSCNFTLVDDDYLSLQLVVQYVYHTRKRTTTHYASDDNDSDNDNDNDKGSNRNSNVSITPTGPLTPQLTPRTLPPARLYST
mmetsp:Transcript_31786/g.77163  ORF Transcript_31786/g.77163 Transcript_31786/m.77163 type:complete len:173 (-) Transcript_31786:340-858(-)